jgi:hypothetical protein
MSELYLIAHKVRGEPAFDIAARMECPICHRFEWIEGNENGCPECDGLGFWWIIPTSGHRAYPYEWQPMTDWVCTEMPNDLPDHYQTRVEPSRIEQLKAMLPRKPVYRRF